MTSNRGVQLSFHVLKIHFLILSSVYGAFTLGRVLFHVLASLNDTPVHRELREFFKINYIMHQKISVTEKGRAW